MSRSREPLRRSKTGHDYRSAHRRRSHDQAHAEADLSPPPQVLDHALVPAAEPHLVTTARHLSELINTLQSVPDASFGYDTEFIGEHTYHPRLCVIQVATKGGVWLIDALASLDLTPFWRLLADPAVEKVVHAGLHDLEPVVRHLGVPPANIFDTQIAAAFAGLPFPMSTAKLIQALTGADPGAGPKFSQWDHRPLSHVQLLYAANDVRYLPLLRHMLSEKLAAAGTSEWALQECASLANAELYRFDASSQRLRVRGVEQMNWPQRTVLRALLAWRERAARDEDVPPRSLLRDEIVYAMSIAPVSSVEELRRIRGLPRPVEQRYGPELVKASRDALSQRPTAGAPASQPRGRPDRHAHRGRIESVWTSVERLARQRGIDPAIVTSKKEIGAIIQTLADGRTLDHAGTRMLRGWRRELLATVVEPLIAGR